MMLTGNVIVDAVISGASSAVAGLLARHALRLPTHREFYKTGGRNLPEAMSFANELRQSEGWNILGSPRTFVEHSGHIICDCGWHRSITTVNRDIQIDACPECGEEVYRIEDSIELVEIELFRDVADVLQTSEPSLF